MTSDEIRETLAILQQAMTCPGRPTISTADCTCPACVKTRKKPR